MIDSKHFRLVCGECDGDIDITHEDIYGEQYQISFCPFCGSEDIELEEELLDEEF